MKLDLNKFYNSNYKDFVHKEALEEALRMVAEIDLKDVEIDAILSITFSVDEFGENPMYVEYLDKDGKKHIVRIRPAVTNEIQEILKRYVTLEQHETDKNAIYNHFERLNVPLELRSANDLDEEGNREVILNNDNSFISFQVDPEQDDAIQWLCIENKNGSLGTQYQYLARFGDYAKVDEVPSNAEFLEKIQQLEELIQRTSQETLQNSKEYTDTQDDTLRTEIMSNVTNQINETKTNILSYVDVKVDELKEYVDNRDAEYHELSKRYTDNAKQEAVNSCKTYTDTKTAETLETSKTYTNTKHTEVTQQVTGLNDKVNKKTNSYIWDKNIERTIDFGDGNEVFYDVRDGKITKIAIKENTGVSQKIVLFDDFVKQEQLNSSISSINSNKADKQTVEGLSQLVQEIATKVEGIEITAPQPIEMTVSYNGSALELNNYSSYTTIGNTTIVNINCNFTAPFTSGATPILNTLNISSETLKSFPRFMMDCIVKTATNVSSYTTTAVFSNKISSLFVETPVIASNETIATSLISFNGSYIFNNTEEVVNND